jgi:hypothetical protein
MEMRGEAKVTLPQALLHQSPRDTALSTQFCLTSAFSTSRFVLSGMEGKTEQRVCNKFCAKLGISATETLELLREAFGK